MKFKSVLALLLLFLMCLPFAAGCSETEDKESAESTSQSGVVTTAAGEEEDIEISALTVDEGDLPYDDADLFQNKKDVFNILLLGIDDINDLGISDTIMLFSVSKAEKKLKIVSFAEDTVVNIPGYRVDKLSMAYALGGAKLAVDTVRQNFDVDVHRYAVLNYFTFEDAVNILGGIELELTKEDVNYINDLMKVNGETEGFVSAVEGKLTLDGKQALCHLRNCGGEVNGNFYEGDDFTRNEKQREFLQAVVKRLSTADVSELREFAGTLLPILNSDLTMEEMQLFVANILSYLDYSVEDVSVPFENGWSYSDDTNSRIDVTDWNDLRNKLDSFIYGN